MGDYSVKEIPSPQMVNLLRREMVNLTGICTFIFNITKKTLPFTRHPVHKINTKHNQVHRPSIHSAVFNNFLNLVVLSFISVLGDHQNIVITHVLIYIAILRTPHLQP